MTSPFIVRVEPDIEFLLREWIKKYDGKVEWDYLYSHITFGLYLGVALNISNTVPQAYKDRVRMIGIFEEKDKHTFHIIDKNRNRTGEVLTVADPEFFQKLEKCIEKALGEFNV